MADGNEGESQGAALTIALILFAAVIVFGAVYLLQGDDDSASLEVEMNVPEGALESAGSES